MECACPLPGLGIGNPAVPGWCLWYIRSVLEPLIIAAFIAYLINPAINFLITRRRMSRKASVNLVYFITLAVLIGTPATLTSLLFDEFTQVITDVLNQFDNLIVSVGKTAGHTGYSDQFRAIGQPVDPIPLHFLSALCQTRRSRPWVKPLWVPCG